MSTTVVTEDKTLHADPPPCPMGCCTGTEILCISIPCPITIVLLGLTLTLELPCIRLTSTSALTPAQVNMILGVLIRILQNLLSGAATMDEDEE